MKRKVAISSKPQLDQSIEEACDLLGDLSDIIKGKHVAIKPNDTWASPSDLTPCTQADTLRGTIRYIKRFSPSKITVSGGSGAAQTEDVFRYLGLDKVIEEENVSFLTIIDLLLSRYLFPMVRCDKFRSILIFWNMILLSL